MGSCVEVKSMDKLSVSYLIFPPLVLLPFLGLMGEPHLPYLPACLPAFVVFPFPPWKPILMNKN